MSKAINNNTSRPFDNKRISEDFNPFGLNPVKSGVFPAEDCSGFLFVIADNSTLNTLDFNQVINPTVTLEIVDNSGTKTTYTDGTPTHIIMSLSFSEIEPVYYEDFMDEKGMLGTGY